VNVALYGAPSRWAMTERGRGRVARGADHLAIGPTALSWDGSGLTIDIDELAVPRLSPLRGRVRVMPEVWTGVSYRLDSARSAPRAEQAGAAQSPPAASVPQAYDSRTASVPTGLSTRLSTGGAHLWRPFAPAARVEAVFERPALRWSGRGYFDGNFGPRPLEADFRSWTWQRAGLRDGAAVFFDTRMRDGGAGALALRFGRDGSAEAVEPLPRAVLPRTLWRIGREARGDAGTRAQVLRRMEDAPFYARSALRARLWGEAAEGVHEILDCDRLARWWCRLMLPFRMPRRAGRHGGGG
jgi:carotenoid 1,2-hydratase